MASSLISFPLLSNACHVLPTPRRTRVLLQRSSSPVACCRSNHVVAATSGGPVRRSGNYPPTLWGDSYVQSLTIESKEEEEGGLAEKLKEEVRLLIEEEKEVVEQLELVDVLQQLGVGYHFEEEIMDVLAIIHNSTKELNVEMEHNLYAKSLLFRLLREHGFTISQDIFNSFKEGTGNFKSALRTDIRGLLNLYQASYFGMEGEITLDEARVFTSTHLKDIISETNELLEPSLAEQIRYALELPLNWRLQRLHSRWFIDRYGREEKRNHILLEFAKLDFNIVQRLYKRELRQLSRWWDGMALLVDKLSFCRDRLVENYFWCVGWAFEPKFGRWREDLTKFNCFVTTIDDIYDVYGSLDELEIFTNVVERWELSASEQLPEYMKLCVLGLFNTANNISYKVLKDNGVDITPFLVRSEELERGDVQRSIQCCMHQNNVSESFARKHAGDLIVTYWKRLNKECCTTSPLDKRFKNLALNVPRTAQCFYQHGDGYGKHADRETKERIISVLMEPIL